MGNLPQSFIYGLYDPRDGSLRLIGQTRVGLRRPRSHWKPSALNRNTNLHEVNWIQQLLKLGLLPIIKILENCPIESLDAAEIRWITRSKAEGHKLVNVSPGGSGRGKLVSEETKDKLRRIFSGRNLSEAHKKAISEGVKRAWPEGIPEHIRARLTAGKNTPDSLLKASKSARAKWAIPGQKEKMQKKLREMYQNPEMRGTYSRGCTAYSVYNRLQAENE